MVSRIAVINLVRDELMFTFELSTYLQGRAELVYFQPRDDTHGLLRSRGQAYFTPHDYPDARCELDDAALWEASGAHERHWIPRPQLLREARPLAAAIEAFLQAQRIDTVLIWNGAPLVRALAAAIAARRGLRTIFGENGYLPGTMQLDPQGVNYGSSHTPAIAAGAYRQFHGDGERLDTALALLRAGKRVPDFQPFSSPRARPSERLRRELARLFTGRAWRWLESFGQGRLKTGPWQPQGPYVLLPMQVLLDSQLSAHSPLYGHDMAQLILDTYAAMRAQLPDHRLVVKLHPMETTYGNRAYLRVARQHPDIVFASRQPIQALLPACSLVVTVNSTVGVEAMAYGKPVVTLGRNFYTVPELVEPARSREDLPAAISRALAQPRDEALRRQFLLYLHQRLLSAGSYRDRSKRSLLAASQRILELAGA